VHGAVWIVAFGEISLLHGNTAQIVEVHVADLAKLAYQEISQWLTMCRSGTMLALNGFVASVRGLTTLRLLAWRFLAWRFWALRLLTWCLWALRLLTWCLLALRLLT